MARKYIHFVNKLLAEELGASEVVDRFGTVMEVMRMIEKEDSWVKAVGCLALVTKGIEMFDAELGKFVEAGLPACWDQEGV